MLQSALALVAQHGAPADVDEAQLQWRLARVAYWAGQIPRGQQAFRAAYALFSGRGDAVAAARLTSEVVQRGKLAPANEDLLA